MSTPSINRAQPGKRQIFLPDRLFTSSTNKLDASSSPVASNLGPQLPLNDPPRRNHAPPFSTKCKRLHRAPLCTKSEGITRTPQSILNISNSYQLKSVKRSKNLWKNLKAYVDAGIPKGRKKDQYLTTWSANGAPELADAKQQADAVYALGGWAALQAGRPEGLVNSEMAVEDQVCSQLIEPLDLMMRTRYRNTVTNPLVKTKETWIDHRTKEKMAAPEDACTPQWGRPVPASHVVKMKSKASRKKAGYPDLITYKSPDYQDHGAIIEIKSFLAFTDAAFDTFFTIPVFAKDNSGLFAWHEIGKMHKLVRQIWGELHSFKARWGFVTNGSKIIVFVKTGRNELTFSEVQDWEQDDVLHALTGLTFAAIDSLTVNTLISKICPAADRDTDFQRALATVAEEEEPAAEEEEEDADSDDAEDSA
ncbi:unnamed protein product [Somion occarium]|uniref:Uncharacterized protein n=1 Tax=Somion occarium TaxID=3059160 RepID=A0ABP1CSZ7_9APHY